VLRDFLRQENSLQLHLAASREDLSDGLAKDAVNMPFEYFSNLRGVLG
jgi:hypothetical protein